MQPLLFVMKTKNATRVKIMKTAPAIAFPRQHAETAFAMAVKTPAHATRIALAHVAATIYAR